MAYVLCDSGGRLLIGATSASTTSVWDGSGSESCSLRLSRRTVTAQAMEDAWPQEDTVTRQYEATASRLLTAAGSGGFWPTIGTYDSAGATLYMTYSTQNGTTICAAAAIVVDAGDDQRQQDYERQTITLRSTGEPDVG